MSEEIKMREFKKPADVDVNEVEVEDVVNPAVQRNAERQREQQESREEVPKTPEEGASDCKTSLSEEVDELMRSIDRRRHRRTIGRVTIYLTAAAVMLGGWINGMADAALALPFGIVYFMLAAVHFDRWHRGGRGRV